MKILATDLDGTLYLDTVLIDGVKSAYNSLILNNFTLFHTTNNSSQSTDLICSKLQNLLNMDIDISSIITPLTILENFLINKNNSIYVFGSSEVKNFISNISDTVSDINNCDLIIIGRVDSPSYEKLDIICEAINSGTKCITLNKDLTYPISKTELKPGNGQIAKYVESKSSQILDSLGKEGHLYSQYFFDRKIKLDYVVGDRVDTDIIFGNNVGAKSILVESSIENHMSTTIADERFKDFPSFVSSII